MSSGGIGYLTSSPSRLAGSARNSSLWPSAIAAVDVPERNLQEAYWRITPTATAEPTPNSKPSGSTMEPNGRGFLWGRIVNMR